MPRRSTRAQPSEVPEGERRVTRRSLQAAATPDKPERSSPRAAAKGKTKQPSPSPASRGRGRGRGRSSGGRAKKGKSEEEEEEEESEEKSEETAVDETESNEDKSSETGSGDAVEKKPTKGRGRNRGKSAAAKKKSVVEKEEKKAEEPNEEATVESKEENVAKPEESEEAEEEKLTETKEETVTPKKGRGRRSAGSSPAKAETPPSSGRSTRTRSPRKLPEETPTRRSGRTRKSAGKEETVTPTKDAEEMETEEPTGQKRKREDDETEISEKKQKIEDAEAEVPQKEESMEVEEPKVEAPQESEDMPDKPEEMKPDEMKKAEETIGQDNTEDTKVAETKAETTEPDTSKEETEEPETSVAEAKEPETSTAETEEPEALADNPGASDEKEEAANYPSADEPEKTTVTQPEEPIPMDTTPDTEESEKTLEKEEKPIEKEPEPDMNEYVLVNKEEVPPADSEEVAGALPKEPEPTKELELTDKEVEKPAEHSALPESNMNESEPTSQPVSVIQEPVSSQPEPSATAAAVDSSERPTENGEDDSKCGPNASMDSSDVPVQEPSKDMAAPSNNIDSVAQEPIATIPNPLFQRQFVANPNIDSTLAADVARKFSVVSYNILADCHAPLSKYPWITPDHLLQEYRNKKLLQELQYLDADILCLQEVGSQYYENTLKPTMGALGYEGSYMKRVDDNIDEGGATFVRTNRFTVVSQKGIALRDLAFKELGNSGLENGNLAAVKQFVDKPSVILVTQVRCNNTGKTVTVGNIHVSWEQLAKPDLQCIEVADALKELVGTATPQGAFFICGDFNSWPGSPVYQLTKEGYLSDQSMSELQGVNNVRMADGSLSPLINLWWKGFQHTANNMKSAYHHVLGSEPHTTRYPHNGWVKQVDFVWYSGNTLDTCGVLEAVQQEQLNSGIPNAFFPSDHISLKTDLVFKH